MDGTQSERKCKASSKEEEQADRFKEESCEESESGASEWAAEPGLERAQWKIPLSLSSGRERRSGWDWRLEVSNHQVIEAEDPLHQERGESFFQILGVNANDLRIRSTFKYIAHMIGWKAPLNESLMQRIPGPDHPDTSDL